eukprot:gene6720-9213_t
MRKLTQTNKKSGEFGLLAISTSNAAAKSSSPFDIYNHYLEKYPYITKIVTSGIIGGTGDILIQLVLSKRSKVPIAFDFRRLAVFSSVAGLYIAPVINVWFNWLNKTPVPKSFNNVAKAAYMMFLDQTIGAVGVTVGFFYAFELIDRLFPPYTRGFGGILAAGLEANKRNLWVTLVANWYCWPVINFVNFLWVPLQYRVLFSNVAAVFWNMFLSNVANN